MKRLACGLEQAQCRIAREFHILPLSEGRHTPESMGIKPCSFSIGGSCGWWWLKSSWGGGGSGRWSITTVPLQLLDFLQVLRMNCVSFLCYFPCQRNTEEEKANSGPSGETGSVWLRSGCQDLFLPRPLSVRPTSLVHVRVRGTLPPIYRSDLCWKCRIYPPPPQCPHRRCHASGASGSPRS